MAAAAAGRDRRRADLLVVVGLVIALAAVQWLLRESPRPDDPMNYFRFAGVFSGLDHTASVLPIGHQPLRLGVLVPVAAAQWTFGYSEAAYMAVPVVALAGFGVATYALARHSLGRVGALAAVGLACLTPLVLEESSHPLPDLPMAMWFTAAVALLLGTARWSLSTRRQDAVAAAAGLALGLAWITKENVALLAPAVLAALLLLRLTRRQLLLVATGAAAVVAVELVSLTALVGDPLARVGVLLDRAASDGEALAGAAASKAQRTAEVQGTFARAVAVLPRMLLRTGGAPVPGMAVMLLAPVGAAIAWRRRRDAAMAVVLVWIVGFWLTMVLIGQLRTGAGGHVLRLANARYWLPIVPALAVGTVVGLREVAVRLGDAGWLGDAGRPRLVVVGVTVLAVTVLAPWTLRPSAGLLGGQPHLAEFRSWWVEHRDDHDAVHADFSLPLVRMFSVDVAQVHDPWDGERRSLRHPLQEDAVVVLSSDAGPQHGTTPLRQRLPGGSWAWLSAPPLDWDVRLVASDRRLVVLEPGGTPHSEVVRTTRSTSDGLQVGDLPSGTTMLRARLQFTAQGRGPLEVTCDQGTSGLDDPVVVDPQPPVPGYTAAARSWWRYPGVGDGPFTLDVFCPVLADEVTVAVQPAPEHEFVLDVRATTVYAQRSPSRWLP